MREPLDWETEEQDKRMRERGELYKSKTMTKIKIKEFPEGEVKLCVTCAFHKKHFTKHWCYKWAEPGIDVVTGNMHPYEDVRDCYTERRYCYTIEDHCGMFGRYWEIGERDD